MKTVLAKIRAINPEQFGVFALLVLWASTTFSIALMEITFVVALIFWAFYRYQVKKRTGVHIGNDGAVSPQLWIPLALFFTCVVISFFLSEYPKQSFRGVFKIAKPLLVFIMASDLFRAQKNQVRFDLAFLITFLLVTVDSGYQYFAGKDFLRGFPAQDSSAGLRLVGPFGDFGKMSAYLIMVFPIFLLRFWSGFSHAGQRKRSFFFLILAALAFLLLYLTRCRGPIVALVLSMGCLFIFKRWFKALGIGVLLFIALLAVTPRGMIIHLDAESKEQSIVERVELWKRAFDVIRARPWFGTGINTYSVAHEKYDTNKNWRVRGYYAHNGYLQLAAEIGIPGICFFFLFLLSFFLVSLRRINRICDPPARLSLNGALTGLLAFLLYGLFDTNLQSPQSLMSFWFLAGVVLAWPGPEKTERATTSNK